MEKNKKNETLRTVSVEAPTASEFKKFCVARGLKIQFAAAQAFRAWMAAERQSEKK